jgi:hypothetical protein
MCVDRKQRGGVVVVEWCVHEKVCNSECVWRERRERHIRSFSSSLLIDWQMTMRNFEHSVTKMHCCSCFAWLSFGLSITFDNNCTINFYQSTLLRKCQALLIHQTPGPQPNLTRITRPSSVLSQPPTDCRARFWSVVRATYRHTLHQHYHTSLGIHWPRVNRLCVPCKPVTNV